MTAARRCLISFVLVVIAQFSASVSSSAQQNPQSIDPSLYSAMRWRLLGPYRVGRVTVAGISGDPAVYYMYTPGGGAWKTTDGGRVWNPIFDDQHVASIGAVALAPSNHNIIYVGTGEQTLGNVYKSTDAGATWMHIGLEKTRYISSIVVDPHNSNIVIVGALGHPVTGVSSEPAERGVFKSIDGGKLGHAHFRKTNLMASPICTRTTGIREKFLLRCGIRATLSSPGDSTKQDGWIYKSSDEGSTWDQVAGMGLPSEPLDRVGLAIAPGTRGRRVYAITGLDFFVLTMPATRGAKSPPTRASSATAISAASTLIRAIPTSCT